MKLWYVKLKKRVLPKEGSQHAVRVDMMNDIIRWFTWVGILAVLLINPLEAAKAQDAPGPQKVKGFLEVHIYRLIMDPVANNPVVLLGDADEKQALPIWISIIEANAMYAEIMGVSHQRPLTHDLLERIVSGLQATLRRVLITHVEENVYYATLVLEKDGAQIKIDARPSDSIVLALKFDAPILVAEDLLKTLGVSLKDNDPVRQYGLTLQDLTPELARYLSSEPTAGLLISGVRQNSRAERDGLKSGDIILEIDGQAIEDISMMKKILSGPASAKARILREGAFITLSLHFN